MPSKKKAVGLIVLACANHRAQGATPSDKARRINRILQACRFASEEDIRIIERVLRI